MSLSKNSKKGLSVSPFVLELVGKYFQQLYLHPIRTKSITSCIVASLGNATAQCMYGGGKWDHSSLRAFALFGLTIGGPIPHLFYKILESVAPGDSVTETVIRFLLERLAFTPIYQMISLYTIAMYEGHTHDTATKMVERSYMLLLKDNWRYLSLFQFINVAFVPPLLRVLFGNLIGFCWCIYVARRRRALADRSRGGTGEH